MNKSNSSSDSSSIPDSSSSSNFNLKSYLITIINGPNLNYLGKREPHIYGNQTLSEIEAKFLRNLIPDSEITTLSDKCHFTLEVIDKKLDYNNRDLANNDQAKLINLSIVKESLLTFGQNRHSNIKVINSYTNSDKKFHITPITFQSNMEGEIIDFIYHIIDLAQKLDSTPLFVINPAAYGHTSLALRDCLLATKIKFVEVHLSNPYERESYRHYSYTNDLALKVFSGQGAKGYDQAMQYLIDNEIKITN